MYNLRLIGARLDQFNLRVSVAVVGIFAIITIVSYFYELSRAGLLSHHARYHPRFPHMHREARDVTEPPPGPWSRHPLHQLGSEIESIKDKMRLHSNKGEDKKEINIAVHLGKNDSYARVTNTSIQAYQHKNTHPNYYTSSCLNDHSALPDACVRNLTNRSAAFNNATKVLVYQHEPGGYFIRDCFKFVARDAGLLVEDQPLNSARREEWEHRGGAKKKRTSSILYGGLSFGVCETISQPCLYLTFLPHPITRILTLYDICSKNRSTSYCKVNGLHQSNVTLDRFIHSQKSNLFHKLLYNHRHCKLVGQDEICLPDSGTSFLLSHNEKKVYLDDIVDNLDRWFGIVGLIDNLKDSLSMFEIALGLKFTKCFSLNEFDKYKSYVFGDGNDPNGQYFLRDYLRVSESSELVSLRQDLESDPAVQQLLHADLVIYRKLEEIFNKQLKAFGLHEHLKKIKRVREEDTVQEQFIAEARLPRKISEYNSVVVMDKSQEDRSQVYQSSEGDPRKPDCQGDSIDCPEQLQEQERLIASHDNKRLIFNSMSAPPSSSAKTTLSGENIQDLVQ